MRTPLDLLLPPRCALCAAPGPLVCPPCLLSLPLIGHRCGRCGAPAERSLDACQECRGRRLAFAAAAAALRHSGSGRTLAHRLKSGRLPDLATLGAALIAVVVPAPDVDALTWVPADRRRTLARGLHPPELLARALAAHWRLPARDLLRAPGRRRPQRGLTVSQRRRNVRGSFRVALPPPAAVLVVDDVYTTGATLSECAAVLRRAGAERVVGVALVRAVRGA